jgi:hypothetical protein
MVAEVRGVFGTLTYPHLILPYSAYYGRLASHTRTMGVLGAPLQPGGAIRSMVGSTVLSMLTMVSPYTKPSPYDF